MRRSMVMCASLLASLELYELDELQDQLLLLWAAGELWGELYVDLSMRLTMQHQRLTTYKRATRRDVP
jgi:hypothetical protein